MRTDELWVDFDRRLATMRELAHASGQRDSNLPLALFALKFTREKFDLQPAIGALATARDVLDAAEQVDQHLSWLDRPFRDYLLSDIVQFDTTLIGKWLALVDGADLQHDFESWFLERMQDLDFSNRHDTPRAIARLMASLPATGADIRILDPACGSGGLLSAAYTLGIPHKAALYGQESNGIAYSWAKIRFAIQEVSGVRIEAGEHLKPMSGRDERDNRHRFHTILTNPPFGAQIPLEVLDWSPSAASLFPRNQGRKIASELAYVLAAYDQLASLGTAAIIVPNGVLSRAGSDARIRKSLLEQGAVDTVIALPARLFAPATMIETSILVLRRPADHHVAADILFIDARTLGVRQGQKVVLDEASVDRLVNTFKERLVEPAFSALANESKIEINDYSLAPSNYVEQIVIAENNETQRRTQIEELEIRYHALLDEYELLREKLMPDV